MSGVEGLYPMSVENPNVDDLSAAIRRLQGQITAERERCAMIAEAVAYANLKNGNEATVGSSIAQGIANKIRAQR